MPSYPDSALALLESIPSPEKMKEIPYALEYYLKAEESVGEKNNDVRLSSRIYNSILIFVM
jgi:hypothetical protein